MEGNKEIVQDLIKRSAPEAVWAHCMVHRESLVANELCPELSESDGYSDQNCKLHKDSSIEKETFCRVMRVNGGTVSTTLVLL
jgi:hypothetical protein